MPESTLGIAQKGAGVLDAAKGFCADDPHAAGGVIPQSFTEPVQAGHGPVTSLIVQATVFGQSPPQAYRVTQFIEQGELIVFPTSDNHMKAVGPQIDGGNVAGAGTKQAGQIEHPVTLCVLFQFFTEREPLFLALVELCLGLSLRF